MKIHTVAVGAHPTNCYIVETDKKNALIIDPADEAEIILCALQRYGLFAKKILITHGHFDHISAIAAIKAETGARVYISAADAEMLGDRDKCLASWVPDYPFNATKADETFGDGDIITQDELEFKVIAAPGHTHGSVMFEVENAIFCGDTIFAGSIGRTDFPMSSAAEMKQSLAKIAAIEGDYDLYPGHGEKTTLADEKKYNMYLNRAR